MIIDAFPFNDELDMLALRLGQLNDVVDYFVLVETNLTFRGNPKPLYYRENMHLFNQYNHKIISVDSRTPRQGAWYFEIAQRNHLVESVKSLLAKPDDVITFSDCDEIPNPEVIKSYTPDMGLRNLKQYTFYYNYNHLFDYGERSWSRARIGTVAEFYKWGPYDFRLGPRDLDRTFPSIEFGGWHGSYFSNDLARIRRKVHSISHDDMDHLVDGQTDQQLARAILNGEDLYHRAGIGNARQIDLNNPEPKDVVPPYFLANKERFKMFTDDGFREKNQGVL